MSDRADFYAGLRRARVAAGALIRDPSDRLLVVEPSYKDHWEIPGGAVESGETPAVACARELQEELGLDIVIGRLLVVEYQTEPMPRGDSVMFVYDGGVLADPGRVRLEAAELKSFAFVPRDELATKLSPKLARRMGHALDALRSRATIELQNGVRRAVEGTG